MIIVNPDAPLAFLMLRTTLDTATRTDGPPASLPSARTMTARRAHPSARTMTARRAHPSARTIAARRALVLGLAGTAIAVSILVR